MAVWQDRSRIRFAKKAAAEPIYLAWGRGNPAWDTTTPEEEGTKRSALIDEIGRAIATSVQYVLPDETGPIKMPNGDRYRISADPTQWLYVRWDFDYADAAGERVREAAVFLGGSVVPGLPPGQTYFTKAQVADPGDIALVEHLKTPIERTDTALEGQDYVIPF